MEHFYKNIHGWFNFEDIYHEMVSNFQDGSHFVEVGSWKGCSTSYMAVEIINSGKKIKFDCVDTWLGNEEHLTPGHWAEDKDAINGTLYDVFLQNMKPVTHIINPIRMDSVSASKLYEDNSLDFVFIDANHESNFIEQDIESWYPKVKIGGYFGGHDYDWPSVRTVVDAKLRDFRVSGTSWLKQKI